MNRFYEEAERLSDEIIANRRYLHQHAELGFDLPETRAFVLEKLRSYGYDPVEIEGGITCLAGKGGHTIMLRADMDALPQKEISGVDYACTTGKACHSCGHDCHTAMMLAAAKMLKQIEDELPGTVKILFQPGEETLLGSQKMIDAGVLESPKVEAAMAVHMNFGPCGDHDLSAGHLMIPGSMSSADEFHIHIRGRGAHGSMPHKGTSPINVAADIINEVYKIPSLKVPCSDPTVIGFGAVHSGEAANIIPDTAEIKGNIRSFSRENRANLRQYLTEVVERTAEVWGAKAEIEFPFGVEPMVNDPELTAEMKEYCSEIALGIADVPLVYASEDFANYGAEGIPLFFANVCAGGPEQGYNYIMHNPAMTLDEEALKYGTAFLVNCAYNWLVKRAE